MDTVCGIVTLRAAGLPCKRPTVAGLRRLSPEAVEYEGTRYPDWGLRNAGEHNLYSGPRSGFVSARVESAKSVLAVEEAPVGMCE